MTTPAEKHQELGTSCDMCLKALTHRWQWGRCVPALDQMVGGRRCRCSSPHHGSPPCGWSWRRCPSGRRQAPRAVVHSRCLFGRAGSSAGSGFGHQASAPTSEIHLDPVIHCMLTWKASPLVLPDALEPLLCLIHKNKHTTYRKYKERINCELYVQIYIFWRTYFPDTHPAVFLPPITVNTSVDPRQSLSSFLMKQGFECDWNDKK